jgi:hypothetical protein
VTFRLPLSQVIDWFVSERMLLPEQTPAVTVTINTSIITSHCTVLGKAKLTASDDIYGTV